MYKSTYNLIQSLIVDNMPEIKYVALYNNQFNRLNQERPMLYPAILVEIGQIVPRQHLGRYQLYPLDITIHLALEIYQGLDYGDSQQQEALDHLELLDKINYVLDNKSTYDQVSTDRNSKILLGPLQRTSMITNITVNDSLRISQVRFKCMVGDATAVPTITETDIDEIDVIIDNNI